MDLDLKVDSSLDSNKSAAKKNIQRYIRSILK